MRGLGSNTRLATVNPKVFSSPPETFSITILLDHIICTAIITLRFIYPSTYYGAVPPQYVEHLFAGRLLGLHGASTEMKILLEK
jgi:hypothetical protein